MKGYPKFEVFVKCFTYNQSKFIGETMNGFVIQTTTFPFVCCIVDDASTDGEQDVIKKYIDENFEKDKNLCYFERETDYASITYAQHKSNKNCYFVVLCLKENHYNGKKDKMSYLTEWVEGVTYTASCEGDDFWTSPNKLQKSIDYLEEHPNCAVVCHRFKTYHDENGTYHNDDIGKIFMNNPEGVSFKNNANHFFTQTLCNTYRVRDLDEFNAYSGMHTDAVLGHFLLKRGYGYCINEYMAVYRLNNQSVWSELGLREKALWNYKMYKQLYEYEKDKSTRKAYYSQYASALIATKGHILYDEPFDLCKLISIPHYFIVKLYRHICRHIN